ncbi:MAG: hypothetical protein ABSE49_22285 [Polyangiaceae bacterium]|jgi:hypothetical protein
MNAAAPVAQSYPVALRLEVRRAAQLAHTMTRLIDRVDPVNEAFVWLLGRADEVRAVVGATMREWQEGRLDQLRASQRIATYVRGLEESLHAFFGVSLPPPSQLRFLRRRDTLVDE